MITSTLLALILTGHTLTVNPVAFTLHGLVPRTDPKNMPYRLTEDGSWTFHPGFGLLYRHENLQAGAMYFRDSFGKHAGAVVLGPDWELCKYFHIGVVGGLYVRERLIGIDKFPGSVRSKNVEYVPIITANAAINLPLTERVSFEAGVNSNYVINFFTGGLKYSFK